MRTPLPATATAWKPRSTRSPARTRACAPEPPTSPCTATPSAATPRGRRDLDHQARRACHLGDAGGPDILKVQPWQNVKPMIALEPIAQQLISLITVLCQLGSKCVGIPPIHT